MLLSDEISAFVQQCIEILVGFAGGEYVYHEKLLVMNIDNLSVKVELLIVDDGVMQYDLIIGRDVLSKNSVIMKNGQCRVVALTDQTVNINECLKESKKQKLQNLLNKYAVCFTDNV